MVNETLLKHVSFWIFWIVALLGSFEQALNAGVNPIFGYGLGIPFLHHYIWGLLGVAACYFGFTNRDWQSLVRKIRKAFIVERGNIYHVKIH
jgi:hypothetical protein